MTQEKITTVNFHKYHEGPYDGVSKSSCAELVVGSKQIKCQKRATTNRKRVKEINFGKNSQNSLQNQLFLLIYWGSGGGSGRGGIKRAPTNRKRVKEINFGENSQNSLQNQLFLLIYWRSGGRSGRGGIKRATTNGKRVKAINFGENSQNTIRNRLFLFIYWGSGGIGKGWNQMSHNQ